MKYSKQRELVMRTVSENQNHPTADEVYRFLKPQYPTISLGTVYRNLKNLADLGLLQRIPLPDGSDRYDATVAGHHHLFCSSCGRIYDLALSFIPSLSEQIGHPDGHRVTSHRLFIYGVCSNCVKDEAASE